MLGSAQARPSVTIKAWTYTSFGSLKQSMRVSEHRIIPRPARARRLR